MVPRTAAVCVLVTVLFATPLRHCSADGARLPLLPGLAALRGALLRLDPLGTEGKSETDVWRSRRFPARSEVGAQDSRVQAEIGATGAAFPEAVRLAARVGFTAATDAGGTDLLRDGAPARERNSDRRSGPLLGEHLDRPFRRLRARAGHPRYRVPATVGLPLLHHPFDTDELYVPAAPSSGQ